MKKLIYLGLFLILLCSVNGYIELESNHAGMFESYTIYRINANHTNFTDIALNTLTSNFTEIYGDVKSWHLEREVSIALELNTTLYEFINYTYDCIDNKTELNTTCIERIKNITGYNITNVTEIVWAEIENFNNLDLEEGNYIRYKIIAKHGMRDRKVLIDNIPIFLNHSYVEYILWNVSYSNYQDSQNYSSNAKLILPHKNVQLNGSGSIQWLYSQNTSVSYNNNDDFIFNNATDLLCGFQSFPYAKIECPTKPAGLVSYFTLDEETGNMIDYVGNYNFTNTDVDLNQTGTIHNAYYYDGVTSNSQLVYDNLNTGELSVCAWFDMSSSALNERIFDRWADYNQFLIRFSSNNNLQVFIKGTGGVSSIASAYNVSIGWHFFCKTYSASNGLNLYIDDNTVENAAGNGNMVSASSDKLYIGYNGDTQGDLYHGYLDDARIYNRELTASEVSTIYEKSLNVFYLEGVSINVPTINIFEITNEDLYYNIDTTLTYNITNGTYNYSTDINCSTDDVIYGNKNLGSLKFSTNGTLTYDSGNYSCSQNVSCNIIVTDLNTSIEYTDIDSTIINTYPVAGSITYNNTLAPQMRYSIYYEHNGTLIASGLSNNSGTWQTTAECNKNITGSACVYGNVLNVSNLSQTIQVVEDRICNSYWGLVR